MEQRAPSTSTAKRWLQLTNLTYDPLESFRTSPGRQLRYFRELKSLVVPWVTADGTGYAQQGFKAAGPNGLELTHEVLGVAKFVHDYVESINDVTVPASNHVKVLACVHSSFRSSSCTARTPRG